MYGWFFSDAFILPGTRGPVAQISYRGTQKALPKETDGLRLRSLLISNMSKFPAIPSSTFKKTCTVFRRNRYYVY